MHSLAALADPTRRRIVEMLAEGRLRAGDIAKRFDMSPPAVSQHLSTLKRAHLVLARVEAQRRIYELDPRRLRRARAMARRHQAILARPARRPGARAARRRAERPDGATQPAGSPQE